MEKTEEKKAKRRDEQYSPKDDAEKALYKEDGIGWYAPSTWVEACLRETEKAFKGVSKGSTMKATILSSVFVEPEKIPLGKETYDEIDIRPVVIQRNRIVKGRPKFTSWGLDFTIKYDGSRVKKEVLRQILEEAGASFILLSPVPLLDEEAIKLCQGILQG